MINDICVCDSPDSYTDVEYPSSSENPYPSSKRFIKYGEINTNLLQTVSNLLQTLCTHLVQVLR
jgi:hypothetical protein